MHNDTHNINSQTTAQQVEVIRCKSVYYTINAQSQLRENNACGWDFLFEKMFVSLQNTQQ